MRRWVRVIAVMVVAFQPLPAEAGLPREALQIEQALADLGLPVGVVDGVWDKDTGRATCIWRELTGRAVLRSWPVVSERHAIRAGTTFTIPKRMRVGLNINVQCQSAVWIAEEFAYVDDATVNSDTGAVEIAMRLVKEKTIRRIMPVSTGMEIFATAIGMHRVGWAVNRWWQSTIYPDGLMYRPFFFHDGMAVHGSSTDTLVKWYPASHGCVRMLHADIDALWDDDFGVGDAVYVYGTWRG